VASIIFGPVPSRRLGHSLGINNIPPKKCTYSCVYCQLGRTQETEIERKAFYEVEEIIQAVEEKIDELKERNEVIDYLTFVPDGEPTLDINLGEEIQRLKKFNIKIAVISNSSLIQDSNVRTDLYRADWVSLKIDVASEKLWHRINRPHKSLVFNAIFDGILEFASHFKGELATETMLIKNINDNVDELNKISNFLSKIKPSVSYISIPIRPPAEKWVLPPPENVINMAFQVFNKEIEKVELLIGYEGNAFAFTGNVQEDFLSITSVHPMREDAVEEFLKKAKSSWSIINILLKEEKIIKTTYQNKNFYIRKLFKDSNSE